MAQIGCITSDKIPGDANRTGFPKDSSILYSVKFSVENPWDKDHAAMAGKRHWDVVEAEIGVDKASYLYMQALIDKDSKPDYKPFKVVFSLFRQNQKEIGLIGYGESKPYVTVELQDARVIGFAFKMDSRANEGGAASLGTDRLVLKFSFRGIIYTFDKSSTPDAWDAK